MPSASRGYRRLALATVVTTFLLIVVGGIVRVSESGLGCGPGGSGLDGWPLCRGDILPGTDINAIIEYIHRAAASVVGVLWIALAVIARKRYPALRWVTYGGLALVIAQGLLGALVVEKDLQEFLVAAHLGLAMLLFALTVFLYRAVRHPGTPAVQASRGFKSLAYATQFALFGAIVAGGYMAGSEKEGLAEWAQTAHKYGEHYEGAHFACGNQFPACNNSFLPFGDSFVNIHLTHRVFVYLTTILVIALVIAIYRRRPSPGIVATAPWMVLVLIAQILLGGFNVWLSTEYQSLIVAHLTVATLLWWALTIANLQLSRTPALDPQAEQVSARAEAVTA